MKSANAIDLVELSMEEVDEVSGGGTFAYDIGYAVGVALSKSANAFSKMSSGELAMLG